MREFWISLAVFAAAIAAMSVGVIFSNRRIKGTCGGLAGMTDDEGRTICEACTDPPPQCTGTPSPECADTPKAQAPFSA